MKQKHSSQPKHPFACQYDWWHDFGFQCQQRAKAQHVTEKLRFDSVGQLESLCVGVWLDVCVCYTYLWRRADGMASHANIVRPHPIRTPWQMVAPVLSRCEIQNVLETTDLTAMAAIVWTRQQQAQTRSEGEEEGERDRNRKYEIHLWHHQFIHVITITIYVFVHI